jgi:murein DD-endopeptidase MepM/ murein hydrolase activator NlpD
VGRLGRFAVLGLVLAALALLAEPLGPGGHDAPAPGGAVLSVGSGEAGQLRQTAETTARTAPGGPGEVPQAAAIVADDTTPDEPTPARPTLAQRYRRLAEPLPPTAPEELTGYAWPLKRGRITVTFGPFSSGTRVVDGARFHDGIDIATFCGDRVAAAHDGIVLAAGRRFDRSVGWVGSLDRYLARLDEKGLWSSLPIVVVIDDGNGYRSMYAHLSRATVGRGQRVHAGQLLGYEGATGNASGCHLHYGLFSPRETATFKIRADVVKRMLLPAREIARVDPLRALPPRPAAITFGWGATQPTRSGADQSGAGRSATGRYPGMSSFR